MIAITDDRRFGSLASIPADAVSTTKLGHDLWQWTQYNYVFNNPLRLVDPNGMEAPEECAQDPNRTIQAKVNVIYDQTVNRGQGLSPKQPDKLKKGQLAKAQKQFGTSNIQLKLTETCGRYDVDPDGVTPIRRSANGGWTLARAGL